MSSRGVELKGVLVGELKGDKGPRRGIYASFSKERKTSKEVSSEVVASFV